MRLEAAVTATGFVMVFAGVWMQVSPSVALIVGGALLMLAAMKRVKA